MNEILCFASSLLVSGPIDKINLIIIFEKKFILVFLNKKLFLKQFYIKNKIFTLFFI